jgi:hypothetical protein
MMEMLPEKGLGRKAFEIIMDEYVVLEGIKKESS